MRLPDVAPATAPAPTARVLSLLIVFALCLSLPRTGTAQGQELPLGSDMPSVSASFTTTDGKSVSLPSLMGETATVIVFWSNQCPWVDRYEERVMELASAVQEQGVSFVLVNSNDATAYPQESEEANAERAAANDYSVTYIRDNDAALTRALGASRAPHVFLFDDTSTLVYAGTIDDSPASADNVENAYLRDAIEAVIAGEDVPVAHTKAFGCTLKLNDQ